MKDDTKQMLESSVKRIALDIEEGIEITKENIEEWNDDEQYELGDMVGGFDYIKDALDITYIINSDMTYKGAEVLVGFGGPNIWIDTRSGTVEGAWWGTKASYPYFTDSIGIDQCLEELYQCR